jgi:CBS domain containing-hemolysin-like protein
LSDALAVGVVCALIVVNAVFVAAEFAIVTSRRSRVEALVRGGSRRARVLQRIITDLDTHVSAIQLAITAVSVGIGWIGEPAVAVLVAAALAKAGIANAALVHSVAIVIAFLAITSMLVVAGELAPKFLGLRRTELVALWTAPLVFGFARLTRPMLDLLNRGASLLLKLVGVDKPDPRTEAMDPEELRIFLSDMSVIGRLSVNKRRMLENVFEFAEHTARQIMVPRDRIDYLSLEQSLEKNVATIMETGHTRYPLCQSGLDSVVGMIHIKDMFQRSTALQRSEDLRLIQREMLFVPESQPIDVLQATFQKRRAHMAMVVDEYGVPAGLATMEDVLEELVGEIRDEFDKDEVPNIVRSNEGVVVDGMTLVEDLARELELDVEDDEADTVGGYVTNALGKIARVGDRFALDKYSGRVIEMQGRRVARVLLRPVVHGRAHGPVG